MVRAWPRAAQQHKKSQQIGLSTNIVVKDYFRILSFGSRVLVSLSFGCCVWTIFLILSSGQSFLFKR